MQTPALPAGLFICPPPGAGDSHAEPGSGGGRVGSLWALPSAPGSKRAAIGPTVFVLEGPQLPFLLWALKEQASLQPGQNRGCLTPGSTAEPHMRGSRPLSWRSKERLGVQVMYRAPQVSLTASVGATASSGLPSAPLSKEPEARATVHPNLWESLGDSSQRPSSGPPTALPKPCRGPRPVLQTLSSWTGQVLAGTAGGTLRWG